MPDLRYRLLPIAFLLLAFAAAPALRGQTLGSDVPRSRVVPVREQVEQQLSDSMIRLGAIRIQPALRSTLGYHSNLLADEDGNERDDFGGTLGAGVTFLIPAGEKVFIRGTAVPQYTYFHKADLSHASGAYGAELLMLFNQLSIQAGGSTAENFESVSSEIEAPALGTTDRVYAITELELVPRFAIHAAAESIERAYDDDEFFEVGEVERLDRDSTTLQGGFRYDFRSFFNISAIYELTKVEHEILPLERNYESNAVLLGIRYDTSRFYLNLSAGPREIEPSTPGAFEPYSTVTGSFFAGYELGAPITVSMFGNRTLSGSAFEKNPIFVNQQIGAQVASGIGERVRFHVGGAVGANDYPLDLPQEGLPKRVDDIQELGGGIGWRLYRSIWLNIDLTRTEYDSNLDMFDRTVSRIGTNITTSFSLQ